MVCGHLRSVKFHVVTAQSIALLTPRWYLSWTRLRNNMCDCGVHVASRQIRFYIHSRGWWIHLLLVKWNCQKSIREIIDSVIIMEEAKRKTIIWMLKLNMVKFATAIQLHLRQKSIFYYKKEVHLRLTVNDCKLLSIQLLSLIQNYTKTDRSLWRYK